jgi:hypothetical protein
MFISFNSIAVQEFYTMQVNSTSDTNLDPQNSAATPAPLNPQQHLVKQWQPAVGLEDVATLECLLDEALSHLSNLLTLLPNHSDDTEHARDFLVQFRQPI